ncbi:O-antigen ligase family protein [Nigerium massiliense]|uniref:O-antigen ligase family protein n=1 Tax=Nigerium massiliense TaxID=1522317 RepID=UPI00058F13F8|nr:O-antigen ligase family protein [Nigerium massiliense]
MSVLPSRSSIAAAPSRWWSQRSQILTSVAVVCFVVLFFEASADVLPDGTLFWLITPSRLVLIIGLAALLLAGGRVTDWSTWLDVPLIALIALSAWASRGSEAAMAQFRWFLTGVGMFLLTVCLLRRNADNRRLVLWSAFVGAAVAGLAGVRQWAAEQSTGFCRAPGASMADGCERPGAMIRVAGSFFNPNLLAAFLVLVLPLAWVAAVKVQDRLLRLASLTVAAMTTLALVLTWSRGAFVAFAAGALVFFLASRPTRNRLIATGAVLLVGALALPEAIASTRGPGVRVDLWGAALSIAGRHPFGIGLGNAGPAITAQVVDGRDYQHAHNLWLNWFVEAGWLGGLAVVALTVVLLLKLIDAGRRGSLYSGALGAGMTGFLILSLADHPANLTRIAMTAWVLVAAIMTLPGTQLPTWSQLLGWSGRDRQKATEDQPESEPGLSDVGLADDEASEAKRDQAVHV